VADDEPDRDDVALGESFGLADGVLDGYDIAGRASHDLRELPRRAGCLSRDLFESRPGPRSDLPAGYLLPAAREVVSPGVHGRACKTLQLDLGEGIRRTAAFQFTN